MKTPHTDVREVEPGRVVWVKPDGVRYVREWVNGELVERPID